MTDRIALPEAIDAIFLDAGGVLIVPDLDGIIDRHGLDIDANTLLTAFFAANDLPGQPDGTDEQKHRWLWERTFENLGHDPASSQFAEFLDTILEGSYTPFFPITPAPKAAEALALLGTLGADLVIVSNANGTIAEEMRKGKLCQIGDGEGQRMKAIIDSGAIGHINKPDPQIFKLALEAAGTTCDRVVHIGDSAWSDMEGARRSGIAGIHINPTKSCDDESHFHAHDILDAVSTYLL